MFQEGNYPPIESAKWRYLIVLRDQDLSVFPKSAAYRRRILYDKGLEKKRRDKLLPEARECLSPLDKVYDVLRKMRALGLEPKTYGLKSRCSTN